MNDLTDSELLRSYAEHGAEAAFAELVRRHVDFIHSAARRMVCDAHLAQDVTQAVFIALANNAPRLTNRPVLSGWLHRTAQNIAAQTVRTDVRRRAREQEAAAMNDSLSTESDAVWECIAPKLDAALGELREADRDALLLRFFERQSAHQMGQTLGISQEAAQKRVHRAVDRLRAFFAKQGVTVGVSGLMVALSANAVQTAPFGLGTAISAAALLTGTAAQTANAVASTTTLSMTILQKTVLTATLAIVTGAGIYEARQASALRSQNKIFQQLQASLGDEITHLQRERDDAKGQLAILADEIHQLKGNSSELLKLRGKVTLLQHAAADPSEMAARDLVARVNKLKQRLEQSPNAGIPELQLLSEQDWLTASRGWDLDSENGFRNALSGLRGLGEQKFANLTQGALAKFSKATAQQFPTELSQLQPYFDSPMDDAILRRWEIIPAGATLPGIGNAGPFVTQKAPVDDLLDRRWAAGSFGSACTDFLHTEIEATMLPVYKAYAAANGGVYSSDPDAYLPYATTPEQRAAVQKLRQQSEARK